VPLSHVRRLHADCCAADMMVQPYVSSVEAAGELSVVVIDGAISHALVKRPVAGDFRTQEEHGGVPTRVELTAAEVAAVQRVLAGATSVVEQHVMPVTPVSPTLPAGMLPRPLPPGALLFARVDFLRVPAGPEGDALLAGATNTGGASAAVAATAAAAAAEAATGVSVDDDGVLVASPSPSPSSSGATPAAEPIVSPPPPAALPLRGCAAAAPGDSDARLLLLELEVIEPALFFRLHPPSADSLAAAIERRWRAVCAVGGGHHLHAHRAGEHGHGGSSGGTSVAQ
jgi:hypothetical protein